MLMGSLREHNYIVKVNKAYIKVKSRHAHVHQSLESSTGVAKSKWLGLELVHAPRTDKCRFLRIFIVNPDLMVG